MFRLLHADEIEARVATVNEKGCSLLLYKDARCDMNILDETVGAMNWERTHSRDNANCTVSIWDKDKEQWISKEDTGTESFTEKEKGLASDSFKRACFNWGIGRELYTAPFIWISADKVNLTPKNGKYTTNDKFVVAKINYDESKRIIGLVIHDKNAKTVFSYETMAKKEEKYNCSICGAEVKSAKIKGEIRTPKEILDTCGGMCLKCYRENNKQEDK